MDRSRVWPPGAEAFRATGLLIALLILLFAWSAAAAQADLPLQLEVSINGQPTNLVAGFAEEGGELASTPAELGEIGIAVPPGLATRQMVRLHDIANLQYNFDRARQQVDIQIGDGGRLRHRVDAASRRRVQVEHGSGAVLNYALVGTLNDDDLHRFRYDPFVGKGTLAAHIDGRIFMPAGAFEGSGIGRTGGGSDTENLIRLDNAWTTENTDTLLRWRLGDTVAGGLSWTRPVRMGGVQLQRNFALRPDLVTAPMPVLGGTAAVPSTVDVYINNVKALSQSVPAGPFSIANLPVVSGAGNARIVVRDAAGRETTTDQAFYSAATMLAPGLYDYSVETGFARRAYGTASNDYDDAPIASASARWGLSERLTIEAHAEGGAGLLNAGAGAVTPLGKSAVLSGSLTGSSHDEQTGGKATVGIEAQVLGISVAAQSQRAFAGYMDLAGITSQETALGKGYRLVSARPLRALDLVSVGVPISDFGGNLNLAFLASTREDGDSQRILTASYSQRLLDNVSAYATGYRDIDSEKLGVFAGLSISLGGGHHAALGAGRDQDGASLTADYAKASGMTPGSVGWRATVKSGANEQVSGRVDWTGDSAHVEAGAVGTQTSTHASMVVTGSIATAGGGVFLANRIDDSFAVVDAGAPGVDVLHENRKVGTTDASGRLLVSGLRSNQENRIAIDPLTLPLDIEAPPSARKVAPAARTGIVVTMRGRPIEAAAIVVLRSPDGAALPAGATGRLGATGEAFVVGYDGEVYLHKLGASNVVTVDVAGAPCTASFAYNPGPSLQGRIEGVICR